MTTISVEARRWFQKTYGNTYHSVKVYVDHELIGYVPFAYGYGESYLQTAMELAQKTGHFPKTDERLQSGIGKDYIDWIQKIREDGSYHNVQDVPRKKDLAQ